MLITDSQVHLWLPDSPERPWPTGTSTFAHGASMGPTEMIRLMDAAKVDRAVLVPPSWEGDRNEYCTQAAREHPDRFTVAGRVPLVTPMSGDALRAWCDRYLLRAIRLTFSRGESRKWLDDGTADWLWAAAERAQVPVFLYAPGLIQKVDSVARRYPRLRITLDHLTLHTDLRDNEIDPHLTELVSLAVHANVAVKASSMPSYVTEGYPFRSMHTRIRRVIDAFGAHRVFWGSDVTRLPVPYKECVTLFTQELDFLSPSDLELVMGGALSSWIGWPEPAHDA